MGPGGRALASRPARASNFSRTTGAPDFLVNELQFGIAATNLTPRDACGCSVHPGVLGVTALTSPLKLAARCLSPDTISHRSARWHIHSQNARPPKMFSPTKRSIPTSDKHVVNADRHLRLREEGLRAVFRGGLATERMLGQADVEGPGAPGVPASGPSQMSQRCGGPARLHSCDSEPAQKVLSSAPSWQRQSQGECRRLVPAGKPRCTSWGRNPGGADRVSMGLPHGDLLFQEGPGQRPEHPRAGVTSRGECTEVGIRQVLCKWLENPRQEHGCQLSALRSSSGIAQLKTPGHCFATAGSAGQPPPRPPGALTPERLTPPCSCDLLDVLIFPITSPDTPHASVHNKEKHLLWVQVS